jgi:hypothetical protein
MSVASAIGEQSLAVIHVCSGGERAVTQVLFAPNQRHFANLDIAGVREMCGCLYHPYQHGNPGAGEGPMQRPGSPRFPLIARTERPVAWDWLVGRVY